MNISIHIREQLLRLEDRAEYHFRRLCGQPSPMKRLVTVLILVLVFGGLNIWLVVSSIYNIGKRDAERIHIEHIKQLELKHSADSMLSIKNYELQIKNQEYEYEQSNR
ncbi:MAG: TraL conjugative transposon family protein [Bacteroidales bacterium]|jgi:hypothetical protein|nr:TraL conjugative transposon family protein [Bacteroidales bacterium]